MSGIRRGIAAQPVLNGYCGGYEYGMQDSNIFDKAFTYGWPNSGNSAGDMNRVLQISSLVFLTVLFFF